jgi:hypothetical protein
VLYWKNSEEETWGIARITSALGLSLAGFGALSRFSLRAAWRFPIVRLTEANFLVFFATPMVELCGEGVGIVNLYEGPMVSIFFWWRISVAIYNTLARSPLGGRFQRRRVRSVKTPQDHHHCATRCIARAAAFRIPRLIYGALDVNPPSRRPEAPRPPNC